MLACTCATHCYANLTLGYPLSYGNPTANSTSTWLWQSKAEQLAQLAGSLDCTVAVRIIEAKSKRRGFLESIERRENVPQSRVCRSAFRNWHCLLGNRTMDDRLQLATMGLRLSKFHFPLFILQKFEWPRLSKYLSA